MVMRFDVHSTGVINFDEYCIMMGPGYYTQGEQAKMLETGLLPLLVLSLLDFVQILTGKYA